MTIQFDSFFLLTKEKIKYVKNNFLLSEMMNYRFIKNLVNIAMMMSLIHSHYLFYWFNQTRITIFLCLDYIFQRIDINFIDLFLINSENLS